MTNLDVGSHVSVDELLNGVTQLNTQELEAFVSQVLTLRAQRVAPYLSHEEGVLLTKINQTLPPESQSRYDQLTQKRRAETLTPEEYQELLTFIERIEQADAERLEALGQLAQLRNLPVKTLMAQLDIHPPAYA